MRSNPGVSKQLKRGRHVFELHDQLLFDTHAPLHLWAAQAELYQQFGHWSFARGGYSFHPRNDNSR